MSASAAAAAPFSRAVVSAMRKLYPEQLADKSWDNTGLLLEAPFDPLRRQMNSVLLTVDLTKAVADEAIERHDSIVVAYHPIIFRGLKSITLANSQQQSLLRLAAEGISVYCPHSALDAAEGGLTDWLADIVTGQPATAPEHQEEGEKDEEAETETDQNGKPLVDGQTEDDPFTDDKRPVFMLQHHPSHKLLPPKPDLLLNSLEHTREPIQRLDPPVPGHEGAGAGRIVRFKEPQSFVAIIERVARGVGNPKGFPIAIPQGHSVDSISISNIGICAGSGSSLLSNLPVDMLFTGELPHHDALAAIERGQCVVTLFHSNTERGFLHSVLREQLEAQVKAEWEVLRKELQKELPGDGSAEDVQEALDDGSVVVDCSERDRDPFGIVISKAEI